MMNSGNSLLLRLFKSEFFNAWIAVSYLYKYPDAVGIQHYLCNELKRFPLEEVEFFLPQLVHLLISRPSESVALENFILDRCQISSHMAILTLWYLQAYTSDLAASPNTPSFKLCKRVFNKCQAIVFATETSEEYEDVYGKNSISKVKENAFSAMVGMGVMLAAFGQPLMTKSPGQLALAQGRRPRAFSVSDTVDDNGAGDSQVQPQQLQQHQPGNQTESQQPTNPTNNVASHERGRSTPAGGHVVKNDADVAISPKSATGEPGSPHASVPGMNITAQSIQRNHFVSSPSLEDLRGGQAFRLRRDRFSSPRHSHDTAPSSPVSLKFSDHDSIDGRSSAASLELARRSYFHSEMQFLLALVDIATRLVIVPKPARLSALRAELTLLNHNLPAEICIPLWCKATVEKPSHHRVVRIPPQDAVVLNSADRVPYLLQVEILETDMSVEEIRAQRRDLHESEDEGVDPQEEKARTKEVEISEDGAIKLEDAIPTNESSEGANKDSFGPTVEEATTSSSTTNGQPTAEAVSRPPVGSLADLAISPPGSPVPSSPIISTDSTGRMKSPAPSAGSGRPVTHSRSNEAYLQTVLRRRASNSADDFAEKMRTAAVMLAQLSQQQAAQQPGAGPNGTSRSNSQSRSSIKAKATSVEDIRAKIIKEMMALEEQRMQRMKLEGVSSGVGGGGGEGAGSEMLEDERKIMANVTSDDPSAAVFAEDWETKMNRIRANSPYGHLPSWQLLSVIVKQGADLRQEQLACQLIREMGWIWERAKVDVWITYMRILVTSDNSGLIETVRNTISIHSIKKDAYARRLNEVGVVFTLYDYFRQKFGDPASERYIKAQDNFMRSLAAYSVITYVLQIRDRHNGNILLDTEGHIIHIDFGFMLSNSPGSVGFELAPFKLPQEYLDVLGGVNSEKFAEFKVLLKKAFMAIRKHTENIVLLIDMMSKDSKLPCFQYGDNAAQAVRDRLVLNLTEVQAEEFVEKLIMSSCCNVFTRLYDTFQYYSNGIL
ncbi:Phosphatidylinositol 4-kinase pik1alpha (PI4-kinase)(PtdIns-4-kinase) [Lobosporangium transversale]|uniref:1-phosphatidylinositol 4-kinase n=1 Tax=Lobosporangium transversale TaxID=64571 RepID=A0A1Y2GM75_9FUNG|nr:kinase-like domain-containing protein [Lobosporangium transversale]KAF9912246.1 Phosphatidylinositol 4-kinase pik1alpha (PI4-kinase)(PtdIns-4-kinase) [Lobosporangium transversale]ORZ13911.1 kinase-like domain-containing protein [Lobosporangium transversale]|eukprot:XP_021880695.1 kinase-like domain-containing protein [Lobosporangium transversale]